MTKLLKTFTEILQEIGVSAVQRERMALFQDQLQLMEKENVTLKKENARLIKEKQELTKQLEQHSIPEQFVEYGGVLFRKSGGRYNESPYCPGCKILMSSMEPGIPFFCSRCDHMSSLTPMNVPEIIKKLAKKQPEPEPIKPAKNGKK